MAASLSLVYNNEAIALAVEVRQSRASFTGEIRGVKKKRRGG